MSTSPAGFTKWPANPSAANRRSSPSRPVTTANAGRYPSTRTSRAASPSPSGRYRSSSTTCGRNPAAVSRASVQVYAARASHPAASVTRPSSTTPTTFAGLSGPSRAASRWLHSHIGCRRRTSVPRSVATTRERLSVQVAGRPADLPLWPGNWWAVAAEMSRGVLTEAGIPAVSRDADGFVFLDFHAVGWQSFLTHVAQKLAGHSTPLVTARYTRAPTAASRSATLPWSDVSESTAR
jgi:hypothetical protein